MDDNNRRRRHNEPPYPGSDSRFPDQGQGRGFSSSSSDRYRSAPLTASPSTSRGPRGATAYSGYYQEPASTFTAAIPQSALQYQANYPPDQRQQQQGFGTYNPELMYNVAQPPSTSNVYDSTPQFQTRQPAAMQMLSDVAAPYFSNESTPAAGSSGLQHHAAPGSSGVYQQHQQSPGDRAPLLQQSYSAGITMGTLPQNGPEILEGDDFHAQGPGMEQAYVSYQTALKEIFQNIINGHLAEASQSLFNVSKWLLEHVGDLGLTVDEAALHSDRIRLWGEFNYAWLSIFQQQRDMLESGHRIQHPQSLMTQDFIKRMGNELTRLCDTIEKHGLVDYQYGVAEEMIISIIMECLDLQQSIEGVDGNGAGTASR